MRTAMTTRRLKKLKAKHVIIAKIKPLVASIGTGKAKSGFDYTIRAKQTKRK